MEMIIQLQPISNKNIQTLNIYQWYILEHTQIFKLVTNKLSLPLCKKCMCYVIAGRGQ